MSESPQHLALVKKIRDAVREREGVTPSLVVAEDHEENTTVFLTGDGYRPDVYYCDNTLLILGEAKTSTDLSSWHSEAQFNSYFKYLGAMANSAMKVSLYVGVPWSDFVWTKNHLRKIKPDSVNVVVINDFGFEEEL